MRCNCCGATLVSGVDRYSREHWDDIYDERPLAEQLKGLDAQQRSDLIKRHAAQLARDGLAP